MKTSVKVISLLVALCLVLSTLAACGGSAPAKNSPDVQSSAQPSVQPSADLVQAVDYAASLVLNRNTDTAKQKVTVKTFIDGDTVHFNVPHDLVGSEVLKARFLAVNTPESTGKIEEYGKKASQFTKEKLSSAQDILIESDSSGWDLDSTGGRYLVWVWYLPEGEQEYRNLNVELLQNGLAIASSAANNRYGDTCVAAINQARAQKLNVYSGQKDPDFYYGDAVELTLKELRTNIESYEGVKVAFNGVITMNTGSSGVYVEEYDAETGLYYGMSIYYGYNLPGEGLEILSVGNRARIVGTVQYYAAGGTYQVSGLSYRQIRPNDPNNIQKLSSGHTGAFLLTDPDTFVNGKVTVESEDGSSEFDYAALTMSTSVSMEDLKVVDVYTTDNEDSSSHGAMTLTCQRDGVTVSVRTAVLLDDKGQQITADAYQGKVISVRGIVDYFDGAYQIKVFSAKDITIQ